MFSVDWRQQCAAKNSGEWRVPMLSPFKSVTEKSTKDSDRRINIWQTVVATLRHIGRIVVQYRAGPKIRRHRGLGTAQAVKMRRPDLILLDFNLPDIDGRNLILTLKRQLGGVNAPPIIAVTARTGQLEEKVAERFGCDAFVRKPFDPAEFLALILRFTAEKCKEPNGADAKNV